eukprot:GEMP01045427.1.p1 GENE.GEMP01045427.1~~GEMP01045427.1.p1  ORF type:complete len:250 (+),score=23.02 GEMP01045427.1:488-1237(+)
MLSALHRYLGTLPRGEGPSGLSNATVNLINVPPIDKTFSSHHSLTMVDSDASAKVVFMFPLVLRAPDGDVENSQFFEAMMLWNLLETKLVEALRFRLGKIYNICIDNTFRTASVRPKDNRRGRCLIEFNCHSNDIKPLTAEVRAVLDVLRETGFDASDVENAKKHVRLSLETDLRTNEFWIGAVLEVYDSQVYQGDIGEGMLKYKESYATSINSFTCDVAKKALNRLLPANGPYFEATLRPRSFYCSVL